MIRTTEDLKTEFTSKEELREEIQRLDKRLQILMEEKGMLKQYATYSPNSKGHETYVIRGESASDEDWSRTFADQYLSMDPKKNIHADKDAAGVYRWVSDWEYQNGYPRTSKQVAALREARERMEKR